MEAEVGQRARMSTGSYRPSDRLLFDAPMAEREAQAILAETEPIMRGRFTAYVPIMGLDTGADCDAPLALADALRTFVEDPGTDAEAFGHECGYPGA